MIKREALRTWSEALCVRASLLPGGRYCQTMEWPASHRAANVWELQGGEGCRAHHSEQRFFTCFPLSCACVAMSGASVSSESKPALSSSGGVSEWAGKGKVCELGSPCSLHMFLTSPPAFSPSPPRTLTRCPLSSIPEPLWGSTVWPFVFVGT